MKRKFSTLTIVLILLLSSIVPSPAHGSSNILYHRSAITLRNAGILKGSNSSNLMLSNNLKRQDMVVVISRLHNQEGRAKNYQGANSFWDLKNQQNYYGPYVNWAVNRSLIQGISRSQFGYDRDVTVQEFQTVLLRSLGYIEEAKSWNSVPKLSSRLGIMKGLNLNPKSKITRGQMSVMILNTLKQTKKGSSLTLAKVLNMNIP